MKSWQNLEQILLLQKQQMSNEVKVYSDRMKRKDVKNLERS